jgi:ATP-dependent RNA helicase DeaD
MICRRGHITKLEIGAIRIFDAESRFEIVRNVAERFDAAVAASQEDGLRITPLADPSAPVKGGGFGGKAQREGKPGPSGRPAARYRATHQHKPANARSGKAKQPGPRPSRGKRGEEP